MGFSADFFKGNRLRECRAVPRYLAQRWRRQDGRDLRSKEALASLSALSRAAVGSPLQPGAVSRDSKPSAAQSSVLRRVRRQIAAYEDCPLDMNPREAHQELLETADIPQRRVECAALRSEPSAAASRQRDASGLAALRPGPRARGLGKPGAVPRTASGRVGGRGAHRAVLGPRLGPEGPWQS